MGGVKHGICPCGSIRKSEERKHFWRAFWSSPPGGGRQATRRDKTCPLERRVAIGAADFEGSNPVRTC